MKALLGGVALAVGLLAWVAPAGAQVTSQPPNTTTTRVTVPQPTAPPDTEPPETAPPTAAPTTRARASSTTPKSTTSTSAAPTTTHSLLPPPSVAPQDPDVPPPGSTQSDKISSVFYVLSVLGFLAFAGLLGAQWFLTRPGRHGWTL